MSVRLRTHAIGRRVSYWSVAFAPTRLLGLLLLSIPLGVFAIGEYDGVWLGSETATVGGQSESVVSGTIVHQPSADTLDFFTESDGRTVTLQGAGSTWALPGPVNAVVFGFPVRFDTFDVQFQGLDRFTGTYSGVVQGLPFTGAFDYRRVACARIASPFSSGLFNGAVDSLRCFQIDVAPGATALRVTMSGGTGDADLIAAYHRADFPFATSDGAGNTESIILSSPRAGKWYVGVIGWENYTGVNLRVTIDLAPPVPAFSADRTTGIAPLTVQFLDESSGAINQWSWEFGDGATSALRNPRHTYAEPGQYDVRLRVRGGGGDRMLTKAALIKVISAGALLPSMHILLE